MAQTPSQKAAQKRYYEKRKEEIRARRKLVPKEKTRAYWQKYYYKNLEKMRERAIKQTRDNPEKHRANARNWNKENYERYKANLYQWRENNKERAKLLCKKYRQSPLGKAAASRGTAKRRSILKQVPCTLTAQEWADILAAYKSSCAYCKKPFIRLTKDHVIPLSRGGHHTKENVVPACRSCNSRKRAKLITPW